jgi:hypothetical protein
LAQKMHEYFEKSKSEGKETRMDQWVDQRTLGDGCIKLQVRRIAVTAALFLCVGSPAWAGGGGAASMAQTAQFSKIVCTDTGISQSFCNSLIPELPTVNQLVLQAAAMLGETPASIRTGNFSTPPGTVFDAGKQATFFYQSGQPLNGSPMPYTSLPAQLGFIAGQGQPIPTNPSNPAVNSLLSATTTPTTTTPAAVNLTFNFQPRTVPTFALNQDVGDINLIIAVANASGNLVRDVPAVLQIRGTGGTAVTTDIAGDFLGTGTPQTEQLAALGMTSSLNVTASGLEFDLGIPLLITSDLTAFPPSGPGFVPANSGFEFDTVRGLFDGIDPIASFFNASFANNAGNLLAAANADLAIAFDASVLLSAPVPTATPEPTTLLLLGSGLVGLAVIRRRGRKTT